MMNTFIEKIISELTSKGVAISTLATDSRLVKKGDIFLAYPGEKTDGRKFINNAITSGASAIIWDKDNFVWDDQYQIPNIAISNLKMAVGEIASSVYGYPSQKLWMVGITGTNGKTSCSHWISDCLTRLGKKTVAIGTLGSGFPGSLTEGSNTTPDALILQRDLAYYAVQGAQAAVMEVSSIGIEQGRINGTHFNIALFTNLTRDHLDYHGTIEAYGNAKAKLFDWTGLEYAIINIDDEFGIKLFNERRGAQTIGYGFNAIESYDKKYLWGRDLVLSEDGITFTINSFWGEIKVKSSLLGAFNASNILAVISVLVVSGVSLVDAGNAVSLLKPVAGRMQCFGGGEKPLVVVDYAHTPDALQKTLSALRDFLPQKGRLLCVFGCGGDRDRGKRPIMGGIATTLANQIIITSDNPRNENPLDIIKEILAGVKNKNYFIEEDRKTAIEKAIKSAKSGDIVLIAGKGHESYQEVQGVKHHFSDIEVTEYVLR